MIGKKVLQKSNTSPKLTGVISFGDASLYINMMGDGDPLVLITGEFFDGRIWDDQIVSMAGEYKVLRYDLRGTGQSSRITTKYSHTHDLQTLLAFLNIQHAHVLGILEGANIALELALNHPDYVRSLILVSATLRGYLPPSTSKKEIVEAENLLTKMLVENSKHNLSQVGTYLVEMNMNTPSFAPSQEHPLARQYAQTIMLENIPQSFNIQLHPPLWDTPPAVQRLNTIHVPTLVLVGERMTSGAHILGDTIVNGIVGAKKVIIPNAPALMNMEQPEPFNQAVLDFLRAIETS